MASQSELLEQCRRGSSKAQFELYAQYSRAMYNVSLRMLSDTMEAENAMQDAFLKAFSNIASFRNDATFGAWLKRIVVNTCIDYLKRRKIHLVPIDGCNVAEMIPDESEEVVPTSVDEVKRAMQQLPDTYRLVLNLHLLDGYDYPEIAEMMGTTQSNVRTLHCRAKQKLIAAMQLQGINRQLS